MSASLIVALGPQNAYLLKHGLLRRTAVFNIAALYVLIDVLLIALGALGVGAVIATIPTLRLVFSLVAAGFFLFYGLVSMRRALVRKPGVFELAGEGVGYATAILVSVANPGVLFDTIVIVGGLAAQYDDIAARIAFLGGAAAASFAWFFTLSALSFFAGGYVRAERIWRVLDIAVGVLMIALGVSILLDLGGPGG